MANTYDATVAALAEEWLTDPEYRVADRVEQAQRVHGLACAIQQTIEDWLDEHPPAEPTEHRHD